MENSNQQPISDTEKEKYFADPEYKKLWDINYELRQKNYDLKVNILNLQNENLKLRGGECEILHKDLNKIVELVHKLFFVGIENKHVRDRYKHLCDRDNNYEDKTNIAIERLNYLLHNGQP